MTAPIFAGGTLWFRRKAALDAYEQSAGDYRQTVLSGLVQVADVLTSLQHDAESLRSQEQSLAAAQEALRLVEANFRAGLVSYLNVLAADTQLQQTRLGYLQLVAQRYQDTTALFVALGGGWQAP